MTSALQAQHQAHKARQERFAAAAARHAQGCHSRGDVKPFIPAVDISADGKPAPVVIRRREYEVSGRSSAYMPTTWKILRAVADEFEMTIDDLRSRHQEPKYTAPRYVAIGLMIELTRLSLPAIGRQLGGRDHTTIISGRRRISALLEGEAFRNRFDQIKASITA